MNEDSISIKLEKTATKGRGVFAQKKFMVGDIVEMCPVLLINYVNNTLLKKTGLYNYAFQWEKKDQVAIAAGYGSFYNHSFTPNLKHDCNYEREAIRFTAITEINCGDELTINYNGDTNCTDTLWFEVK